MIADIIHSIYVSNACSYCSHLTEVIVTSDKAE